MADAGDSVEGSSGSTWDSSGSAGWEAGVCDSGSTDGSGSGGGGGGGNEEIDSIAGGFGSGQRLVDDGDHLRDGGAGWDGFGCNAEKAGQEQPPEELFVLLTEEVVVTAGGVDAREPADVGVGPES